MSANDRQIGGDHYRGVEIQHWDYAWSHQLDYFQGQITKYITRWKLKNGLEDLYKARHFLDKYIEGVEASESTPKNPEAARELARQAAWGEEPGPDYTNQD